QNNQDPTGHCLWCLAAVAGFVVGSVGYMLTHEGSGLSHVIKTYEAGAVSAAAFAGSAAFATVGGQVAATTGAVGGLTAAGNFLVGAGAEVAYDTIVEGKDVDVSDAAIAGLLNLPGYGLGLKPGTSVGTRNALSPNNLRFVGQQVIGSFATSFATRLLYKENNYKSEEVYWSKTSSSLQRVSKYAAKFGYSEKDARRKLAKRDQYFRNKKKS
ncbi:hypothetical protein HY772_00585, partial [Candidatus Woesearchaeota archaeon]|nr:hypothetical protein [Candidatus Woesearchaeota archaeon]